MFLERLIYCLLCLILLHYSARKYTTTHSNIFLTIMSLQTISAVVYLMSLLSNTYVSMPMQIYIFIIGIIFPAIFFISDYVKVNIIEFFDLIIGNYYMHKANYQKAIDRYKKAASKNPTNSETFVKLGRAYNAMGDRRTAFDRFARAIELNRNDYKSYYEIGIIFNELNKKNDAQIVLDNALRIKPDFTPASELLAVVLCAQNKYDQAIEVYKEAIKYAPDNYQLYYSLGIVRTELRDFNEAKEAYEKALELKPDLYEAFFNLGQIHLLKGNFDDAEKYFKSSIYDKDLAAKSYYQLAKVYILTNEEIKAVTYLEYAIELDSSYRYKADTEPLFNKIKDYLTGIHMVSQAQMKLEKEINEKVTEKYADKEYEQLEINNSSFNYMDKYSGKK